MGKGKEEERVKEGLVGEMEGGCPVAEGVDGGSYGCESGRGFESWWWLSVRGVRK